MKNGIQSLGVDNTNTDIGNMLDFMESEEENETKNEEETETENEEETETDSEEETFDFDSVMADGFRYFMNEKW